jgi:hypothetical protein
LEITPIDKRYPKACNIYALTGGREFHKFNVPFQWIRNNKDFQGNNLGPKVGKTFPLLWLLTGGAEAIKKRGRVEK